MLPFDGDNIPVDHLLSQTNLAMANSRTNPDLPVLDFDMALIAACLNHYIGMTEVDLEKAFLVCKYCAARGR